MAYRFSLTYRTLELGSILLGKFFNPSEKSFSISKLKILIIILPVLSNNLISKTYADNDNLVTYRDFKNFYRVEIKTLKNEIKIENNPNVITLQFSDETIFKEVAQNLEGVEIENPFIKSVNIENTKSSNEKINLNINFILKQDGIEVFHFYNDQDNALVLDFWKDPSSQKSVENSSEKKSNATLSAESKPSTNSPILASGGNLSPSHKKESLILKKENILENELNRIVEINETKSKKIVEHQNKIRDFRYGASFIWNYPALIPVYSKNINYLNKTPDFFYPMKHSGKFQNQKETEIQLIRNLYQQGKFGLMNKSMEIFEKINGSPEKILEEEFNYLKANSIIKLAIRNNDKSLLQLGLSKIDLIKENTQNVDFKKALQLYLYHYYDNKNDHLNSLHIAKNIYVFSKETFDEDSSQFAMERILYHLARLNQTERIEEIINEKSIQKLLSPQILKAYFYFTLIQKEKYKDLINDFKSSKVSFQGLILESILFNVSEANFRIGHYQEALENFQLFVKTYPLDSFNPFARLRIALISDILGNSLTDVSKLYKNVIDQSTNSKVRYEAKIRYIGLMVARNLNPSPENIQNLIFLKSEPDETKEIDANIKKILWQVRLRTFINTKSYESAFNYLKTLPLNNFKVMEKNIFINDGSEIVKGLILESYKMGDYPKTVKTWESNKDIYFKNINIDPNLIYLLIKSYFHLGFDQYYTSLIDQLKSSQIKHTLSFPKWIELEGFNVDSDIVHDIEILSLIRKLNIDEALVKNNSFIENNPRYIKGHFLNAKLYFLKKDYPQTIQSSEKFLLESDNLNILNQEEISQLYLYYGQSLFTLEDESLTTEKGKFKKYALNILDKTSSIKNKSSFLLSMREQIAYYLIESLYKTNLPEDQIILETLTDKFITESKDSLFKYRVQFIQGMNLIALKRKEGTEVLIKLGKDQSTPVYLKELINTELKYQKFKSETL
jgi:hypothetical protein